MEKTERKEPILATR